MGFPSFQNRETFGIRRGALIAGSVLRTDANLGYGPPVGLLVHLSGECRHIVFTQCCTCLFCTNPSGHALARESFMPSGEILEVVAIRPCCAFSYTTSLQKAFTVSTCTSLPSAYLLH